MATIATIEGITGNVYYPGEGDYDSASRQYATSSYGEEHDMHPGIIVQANDKHDIRVVLKYAEIQKMAVAIRTGGHQYSGASSTSETNIQLDLRNTFKNDDDQSFYIEEGKAYVRTSVSWSLADFSKYLGAHHVFIPHGQCIGVHLGGHVQTGGYGQLGRSFGLFGDHVRSLEVMDHEGKCRVVTENNKELFYAILGGSPGNLAVITHFTIEVHRDIDHVGSQGMASLSLYTSETLKYYLDMLVEMSENEDFPRNYDFCVTILSQTAELGDMFPAEPDKTMRHKYRELYEVKEVDVTTPPVIIVFAQWVKLKEGDKCDNAWFDRVKERSDQFTWAKQDMSKITTMWLNHTQREYNHPYIKRTYLTNSKTLSEDEWASWLVSRIDQIILPQDNGLYIAAQFQCFGGKDSKFFTNGNAGTTSYSWRDSTVVGTLDCFYESQRSGAKAAAQNWINTNDQEGIGPGGKYSKQDRRVLWGSYGDYDFDRVWRTYHEDEAKYKRLGRARQAADPNGVLTPNTFCVKRIETL